jgi:hypothetical protein
MLPQSFGNIYEVPFSTELCVTHMDSNIRFVENSLLQILPLKMFI